MNALLTWILALCGVLAPGRDVDALASAMAARVDAEPPLFKNDPDKKKTAALLVAVAFREGSLRASVKGDKNKAGKFTSFCTFQVNVQPGQKTPEGWTGEELAEDPNKCVAVAMRMMRESMRMCPDHPIAFYAEGPGACESERAKRISYDRMWLAKNTAEKVRKAEETVASSEKAKNAGTR